jgi:hypothetical protein
MFSAHHKPARDTLQQHAILDTNSAELPQAAFTTLHNNVIDWRHGSGATPSAATVTTQ